MIHRNCSRRQFLKLTTALAAGSFCRPFIGMAADVPLLESRAIWDEGLNWVTKASAVKLLDRIKRAGFNVFVPNVWHGSGTIWPSSLAPWDTRNVRIPGFDPLENLVTLADGYDIEIHPWFTVNLRQRDFLYQYFEDGTPENAFDTHNAQFREFISSLIAEVVLRYPVQGISLDFLITMGLCRGQACIDDYYQKTGRKLLTDWNLRKFPGYGVEHLIAWQQEAITDLIRLVATKTRRMRKDIVISATSTIPATFTLKLQGENSVKCTDAGMIDVLYNMDYRSDIDSAAIRTLQTTMKRPEAVTMLCGNYDITSAGVVARSGAKVAQILTEARTINSGNGVGLYIYSRLSDEQTQTLQSTVFKIPATPKWTRANVI